MHTQDADFVLWKRAGRGGDVFISMMALNFAKAAHDPEHLLDFQRRINVADSIAHTWSQPVYVLPDFFNEHDPRYPDYFPNVPCPGKLPDFRIGQEYWELKSYRDRFKSTKIASMLDGAVGQCLSLSLR